jgi:hypothetical protein
MCKIAWSATGTQGAGREEGNGWISSLAPLIAHCGSDSGLNRRRTPPDPSPGDQDGSMLTPGVTEKGLIVPRCHLRTAAVGLASICAIGSHPVPGRTAHRSRGAASDASRASRFASGEPYENPENRRSRARWPDASDDFSLPDALIGRRPIRSGGSQQYRAWLMLPIEAPDVHAKLVRRVCQWRSTIARGCRVLAGQYPKPSQYAASVAEKKPMHRTRVRMARPKSQMSGGSAPLAGESSAAKQPFWQG